MAIIYGLLALLNIEHAAAIMVDRDDKILSGSRAELPDWFLETWELAEADQAVVNSKARGRPRKPREKRDGEAKKPEKKRPPKKDPEPLDFSNPNRLCFAEPMADVVMENWREIQRNVIRGKEQAKSMKIIFSGLIRNAAWAVRESYEMLRSIGLYFKDYHFLIFENDSKDWTVRSMSEIAKEDPRYEFQSEVLSMNWETGLEESRMKRMAILRNKVRDWIEIFIRESPDWDLVAMYDFDLNYFSPNAVSPHALMGALGRQETLQGGWDMLCANSLRHVGRPPDEKLFSYDCLAYRDVNNESFNHYCEDASKVFFSQYDLVPVRSCFGGLAIYKPKEFLKCRYDPDVYDCEHVVLHKCMRDKGSEGRMFMDPLLTTSYDVWIQPTCLRSSPSALTETLFPAPS